jgi:hypothetical protein
MLQEVGIKELESNKIKRDATNIYRSEKVQNSWEKERHGKKYQQYYLL